MAKVKIQGHASGTGILTVTAPNTSTDRTITLPDETATLSTFDPDGAVTINDTGADVDFRVEGSGAANALFVQGSDGNVGIGINTPSEELHVSSSDHTKILLDSSIGSSKAAQLHFKNDANTYSVGVGTNDNFTIYDETASAARLEITTDGRGNSQFTAKAWVNYNGTSNAVNDSHNVSSVTDNATGDFSMNFDNSMGNANYMAAAMGSDSIFLSINTSNTAPTTARLDFECRDPESNISDENRNCIVVFGD